MAREALFGSLPILSGERLYGFADALLLLSGYCIATWSYTQGAYLATLVGFRQLLIGAFFGAILMLCVYQLPVILSVRYGIDIWIWLRAVFGGRGVMVMTVVIILVNYPWYAVCADLFASSMVRLAALLGWELPGAAHPLLGLACVLLGTLLALRGPGAMTRVTRILVPLLLAVGVLVVVVGFRAVPFQAIWDYQPAERAGDTLSYILSIEANFAFVITLVGGMAGVPRLVRSERAGFWAGVLGQGAAGSFFVVVGAVMAIAMRYVTGEMAEDPTLMLAVLATHHAFMDFYVTPLCLFPHRANYVSELEGCEHYGEWPYRQIGCLGTRKFVNDLALVRNIRRCMERGGILVLYPEARYANVGTSSQLPPSTTKLIRYLKVPVVTINMHGNYLQSPIWNLKKRGGVRLEAQMKRLLTAEEAEHLPLEGIQRAVQEALTYDEYAWQREQGLAIRVPWRAEGLEHPPVPVRRLRGPLAHDGVRAAGGGQYPHPIFPHPRLVRVGAQGGGGGD